MPSPSHADVVAAVDQACRELGLDLVHAASVQAYLAEPECDWPPCCDRRCEPCVATLGAAARRARRILDVGRAKDVPSGRG